MEYKRFEMSDDNYDVVLIVEGNRHTVQITKTGPINKGDTYTSMAETIFVPGNQNEKDRRKAIERQAAQVIKGNGNVQIGGK